jgi:HAMP domain-containing protein
LTLQKQVKFDTNSILQRAGDKLEHQQKNEEIQKLKDEIKTLKGQAEAVKEVLKRSIDSKNDLVIAQTEVEIHHEQCMYIKDLELSHMKAYVRNIEEKQANNDLSSMNEISTLSKEMKSLKDNYSMELAEKEDEINQLKQQVKQLRAALVRGKEIVYRN